MAIDVEFEQAIQEQRALTADEVANIAKKRGAPVYAQTVYRSDRGKEPFYQLLEHPDPESVGLEGYRSKEVQRILLLLQKKTPSVIPVIAPSRSGKSEAVLQGDRVMFRRGTLRTVVELAHAAYYEGLMLEHASPDDAISIMTEEFEDQPLYDQRSKVIILDEFVPEVHKDVAELLVREGYSLVVAQGGNHSNESKTSSIQKALGKYIPTNGIVDFGIKPINRTQFHELIDSFAKQEVEESILSFFSEATTAISRILPQSAISYVVAVDLLEILMLKKSRDMLDIHPNASDVSWTAALKRYLTSSIYQMKVFE